VTHTSLCTHYTLRSQVSRYHLGRYGNITLDTELKELLSFIIKVFLDKSHRD